MSELGMMGEGGAHDLMAVLQYLAEHEQSEPHEKQSPSLKQIFTQVAVRKLGTGASQTEVNREMKASEQRIRRAIIHSLHHFAQLIFRIQNLKPMHRNSLIFRLSARK